MHVVTPNIYRTWQEAWQSFDYITERGNFNVFEKYSVRVSGAVSMYLISQNVLKKRHGIEDERAELYKCLDDWMAGWLIFLHSPVFVHSTVRWIGPFDWSIGPLVHSFVHPIRPTQDSSPRGI